MAGFDPRQPGDLDERRDDIRGAGEGLSEFVKWLAAALPGLPGDVADMVMPDTEGMAGNEQMEQLIQMIGAKGLPTTEDIGVGVLGADPESLARVPGEILSPGPGEIAGALKGLKASLAAGPLLGVAKRGKAVKPGMFPEYADEYPPVPEPVMAYDKTFRPEGTRLQGKPSDGPFSPLDKDFDPVVQFDDEGIPYSKAWVAKGKNQEGQKFMKERLGVSKDVKAGNYDPYFDVEKRFDADPSNYDPRPQYPMPKKQETIDKWRTTVKTPEGKQRLLDAYNTGVESGGHDAWYKMGQLEKEFIDELGPVEGPKMFKERFGDAMAAATGGANPEGNLIMATFGNFQRQKGRPLPSKVRDTPNPVGGRFSEANLREYENIINKGTKDMADNPKRSSFSSNFQGQDDIATVDEHMTQIVTPGLKVPPGDSYFAYEELMQETAKELGISARELQEVAWGGRKAKLKGGYDGKPMIEIVNEAIERTSRLTGKTPKEVVRQGLVRSDMPIYGGAAATTGLAGLTAALANQQGGMEGEM